MKKKRLLTIGHSYVVDINRRLPQEFVKQANEEYEITVVSPQFYHGHNDLRPIQFMPSEEDLTDTIALKAYLTKHVHFFLYNWKIREILNQKWDLIHCWEEPYIAAGFQLALLSPRNTPLVFHTAQNINKKYPFPFNLIETFSAKRSDAFICCGETVKRVIENRPGYQQKPIEVIPLGVDTNAFKPDMSLRLKLFNELNWPDDNIPVIGFMGRFIEDKGVNFLMKALNRVKLPYKLLWIGTGPLEEEIRQWASGNNDKVRIVNNACHNDVPRYLNAIDILCAPSQTMPNWREQFGRMIVESFACGVSVIGSNSGEIPYVIGDAGIVVGEKDEDGWVEAIERVLGDDQLRKRFAQEGRRRAVEQYSWKVVAKQYLNLFEKLM